MSTSIGDITKKRRGRKITTGTREGVLVRLPPDLLAFIDALRERSDPTPSRPEAIRQALQRLQEMDGVKDLG